MRRLKQLEDENAKVKKLVADCSPRQGDAAGRATPKTLRPVCKRQLMDKVCSEWNVSMRRACRILAVDTSSYHYRSHWCGQANLEHRIKGIAETQMRYGCRRVHVVLQHEG